MVQRNKRRDDGQAADDGAGPFAKGGRALNEQRAHQLEGSLRTGVPKATIIIGLITPAVTTRDWSFKDCQDYLVELEVSTSGAIMALRLANSDFNSRQNDHQIT
jgi:hypothetical protein